MLVLHMWLSLGRLRSEGKDGAAMGQSLYDAFNHDLERRIIATGASSQRLRFFLKHKSLSLNVSLHFLLFQILYLTERYLLDYS